MIAKTLVARLMTLKELELAVDQLLELDDRRAGRRSQSEHRYILIGWT